MRSKLLLLVALVFLAVAFPTAAWAVYEMLCLAIAAVLIAVAWIKIHLTLVCSLVALALLLRAYPAAFLGTARWLGRAVAESVRTVMPQPTEKTTP
ncbi:hypothetical protein [Streptomyces sp. NPDC101455]|uniref:hypothetical protein n=1 Tax=Streptomyces sp. NPDC101455 TaxID=3366142 RepID=UPI0037F6A820